MAPKHGPKHHTIAKLRQGTGVHTPIQEAINEAVDKHQNEHNLADYEATGGNFNNLHGDALYTYLDLQAHRQKRQHDRDQRELNEIVDRISEHLNCNGFLGVVSSNNTREQEREVAYFRIISECQGRETKLHDLIHEYIDLHLAKSKHQSEIMHEIEQWFHDLLADKSMEKEFNAELGNIKARHHEQSITRDSMLEAMNSVTTMGQKLKHIGEVLSLLSSASGVKVVDGPPPEREDTITLNVPTESNPEMQFTFTVILDDDALFRDQQLMFTAQQFLKGLVFYGAAAKHKSKASKRKVIRMVLRQLEAIYNVINKLRESNKKHTHALADMATKLEDVSQQKESLFRETERYRADVKETDVILKQTLKDHESLLNKHANLNNEMEECRHKVHEFEAKVADKADAKTSNPQFSPPLERKDVQKGRKNRQQSVAPVPGERRRSSVRPETKANRQSVTSKVAEAPQKSDSKPDEPVEARPSTPREASGKPSASEKQPRQASLVKPATPPVQIDSAPESRLPSQPEAAGADQPDQNATSGEPAEPDQTSASVGETDSPEPVLAGQDQSPEAKATRAAHKAAKIKAKAEKSTKVREEEKTSKAHEAEKPLDKHPGGKKTKESAHVNERVIRGKDKEPDKTPPGESAEQERTPSLPKGENGPEGVENPSTAPSVSPSETPSVDEAGDEGEDPAQPDNPEIEIEITRPSTESLASGQVMRAVVPTANKEVQVQMAVQVQQVSRAVPVQASFAALTEKHDVEVQPSFAEFKQAEVEQLENAQEQLEEKEDAITKLSEQIQDLKDIEDKAKQLEELLEQADEQKESQKNTIAELTQQFQESEETAAGMLRQIHELEDDITKHDENISELQQTIDRLEEALKTRAEKTNSETSTDGQLFGTSAHAQTEDLSNPEIKQELGKLKGALGEFRSRLLSVLVEHNLIADIPSFQEKLRDNWNIHTAAAEIADDVQSSFGALPGMLQAGFDKLISDHRQAFEIVLQKAAEEMEGNLRGADSSEEMRRARMSLRQKVLDLEIDNTQMHQTLKEMTNVLEKRRAEFDTQIDQKKHEISKGKDDTKRVKDLAWTLAETLAKLRDDAVTAMPERKSLVDMMDLLRTAEKKLGKTLKRPEAHKKPPPDLAVEGKHQPSYREHAMEEHRRETYADRDHGSEGELGKHHGSGEIQTPASQTDHHRHGPQRLRRGSDAIHRKTSVSWTVIKKNSLDSQKLVHQAKGSSNGERAAGTGVEYTRYYHDPNDDTVQWETRKVTQEHKAMQTTSPVDFVVKGSGVAGSFPRTAEDAHHEKKVPKRSRKERKDEQHTEQTKQEEKPRKASHDDGQAKRQRESVRRLSTSRKRDEDPQNLQRGKKDTLSVSRELVDDMLEAAEQVVEKDESASEKQSVAKETTRSSGRYVSKSSRGSERHLSVPAYQPDLAHDNAKRALEEALAILHVMEQNTAQQALGIQNQIEKSDKTSESPCVPRLQSLKDDTEKLRRARKCLRRAKSRVAKLEEELKACKRHARNRSIGAPFRDDEATRRTRDTLRNSKDRTSRDNGKLFSEPGPGETADGLREIEKQMREDIKVLTQRRRKSQKADRTRESDTGRPEDSQHLPSDKLAHRKQLAKDRELRIAESRRLRRRRISNLDQAITHFVQNGPNWKRSRHKLDRFDPEQQAPGAPTRSPFSSISPNRLKLSPTRPVLDHQEPVFVTPEQPNQLPRNFAAVGISLEPTDPEKPEETPPTSFLVKPLKRSSRKRQSFMNERQDDSITAKLRFLREQRLKLAIANAGKPMPNPLIRTHRGEEPFEGPVDLAPHNFPDMGVIGRTVQGKPTKEPAKWDPEASIARSTDTNKTFQYSTGTETVDPENATESQTPRAAIAQTSR